MWTELPNSSFQDDKETSQRQLDLLHKVLEVSTLVSKILRTAEPGKEDKLEFQARMFLLYAIYPISCNRRGRSELT